MGGLCTLYTVDCVDCTVQNQSPFVKIRENRGDERIREFFLSFQVSPFCVLWKERKKERKKRDSRPSLTFFFFKSHRAQRRASERTSEREKMILKTKLNPIDSMEMANLGINQQEANSVFKNRFLSHLII